MAVGAAPMSFAAKLQAAIRRSQIHVASAGLGERMAVAHQC